MAGVIVLCQFGQDTLIAILSIENYKRGNGELSGKLGTTSIMFSGSSNTLRPVSDAELFMSRT